MYIVTVSKKLESLRLMKGVPALMLDASFELFIKR